MTDSQDPWAHLSAALARDPRPLNGIPIKGPSKESSPAPSEETNDVLADWTPSGPQVAAEIRTAYEVDAAYEQLKAKHEAHERLKRERLTAQFNGELTEVQDARKVRMGDSIMDRDGIADLPEPVPIIEGLLFEDSLAWVAGPSGSYKSFVALDIAARYGTEGMDYHGLTLTHGKALIVVGEGNSAYIRRVEAWEEYHDRSWPETVHFHNGPLQLGDKDTVAALCSIAQDREYGLVIFDTQAMMTVGVEENSSTEMGVIMNAMHQLRETTGGCILTVHHHGKSSGEIRGSGAIYAAASTVITTDREGHQVTLSTLAKDNGKQKDATEKEYGPFIMNEVARSLIITSPVSLADPTRATPEVPDLTTRRLTLPVLRVLADKEVFGGSAVYLIALLKEEGFTGDLNKGTVAREINKLVRDGLLRGPKSALKVTELAREAMESRRDEQSEESPF